MDYTTCSTSDGGFDSSGAEVNPSLPRNTSMAVAIGLSVPFGLFAFVVLYLCIYWREKFRFKLSQGNGGVLSEMETQCDTDGRRRARNMEALDLKGLGIGGQGPSGEERNRSWNGKEAIDWNPDVSKAFSSLNRTVTPSAGSKRLSESTRGTDGVASRKASAVSNSGSGDEEIRSLAEMIAVNDKAERHFQDRKRLRTSLIERQRLEELDLMEEGDEDLFEFIVVSTSSLVDEGSSQVISKESSDDKDSRPVGGADMAEGVVGLATVPDSASVEGSASNKYGRQTNRETESKEQDNP